MISLIELRGPCYVYSAGVDNNTDTPLTWQLVRDNGNIIVQQIVAPWQPWGYDPNVEFDYHLEWNGQWCMHPENGYLIVPEGTSLTLQATRLAKCRIAYTDDTHTMFYVDYNPPVQPTSIP